MKQTTKLDLDVQDPEERERLSERYGKWRQAFSRLEAHGVDGEPLFVLDYWDEGA